MNIFQAFALTMLLLRYGVHPSRGYRWKIYSNAYLL